MAREWREGETLIREDIRTAIISSMADLAAATACYRKIMYKRKVEMEKEEKSEREKKRK